MKISTARYALFLVFSTLVMQACSSTEEQEYAHLNEVSAPPPQTVQKQPESRPIQEQYRTQRRTLAQDSIASMLGIKRIYFDYNSYNIRQDFQKVVQAHGKYLASQPGKAIMVQGHTDSRGSREYNLALGQRRAESVKKGLVLLGAQPSQIEAVSFGEEKPFVRGRGENIWAQNRRAEIVYP